MKIKPITKWHFQLPTICLTKHIIRANKAKTVIIIYSLHSPFCMGSSLSITVCDEGLHTVGECSNMDLTMAKYRDLLLHGFGTK